VTKHRLTYLAICAWLAAIVTRFPVLIMTAVAVNTKVLKTWNLVGNVCGAVTFLGIGYFYNHGVPWSIIYYLFTGT